MRTIPAAVQALLPGRVQRLALFAALETGSGTLRLWTGATGETISYDGETWTGTGDLIAFGAPAVSSDLSADPMTVTLSAIPSEHVARAITEKVSNKRAEVHLVWFDAAWAPVGGIQLWAGIGSQYRIRNDGATSELTLVAEGRLYLAQQASERVWTGEDQRAFVDANDAFFDGVAGLQLKDLGTWGGPA